MRITDQYFWNFIFSVVFIGSVVMAVIILSTESRFLEEPLQPVDYILMILATWRLVRLFVYDVVTKFIREQFWDLEKTGKGFELVKPKTGPRRTLADLTSCPSCMSMWAGSVVVFFYLLTPWAQVPVIMLAISALALFGQNLGTLVATTTEHLKEGK